MTSSTSSLPRKDPRKPAKNATHYEVPSLCSPRSATVRSFLARRYIVTGNPLASGQEVSPYRKRYRKRSADELHNTTVYATATTASSYPVTDITSNVLKNVMEKVGPVCSGYVNWKRKRLETFGVQHCYVLARFTLSSRMEIHRSTVVREPALRGVHACNREIQRQIVAQLTSVKRPHPSKTPLTSNASGPARPP